MQMCFPGQIVFRGEFVLTDFETCLVWRLHPRVYDVAEVCPRRSGRHGARPLRLARSIPATPTPHHRSLRRYCSLLHCAHHSASHACWRRHSPPCQAGAGVRWLRVLRVADPGSKAARRRRVHAWIVARNASGAGRCGGGRARAVYYGRPERSAPTDGGGERTEACMRRARSRPCRSARRSMTRSCGDA